MSRKSGEKERNKNSELLTVDEKKLKINGYM